MKKIPTVLLSVIFLVTSSTTFADVSPQDQTITFSALPPRVVTADPFSVNASAPSSASTTFASTTTPVCTVSSNTVTIVSVGTCSITASNAGDANYNAAPDVTQSFQVVTTPTTTYANPTYSTNYGDTTSDNHTVGLDAFHTVADAIDAVATEGTVMLSGSFNGDINISKSITLSAQSQIAATVNGVINVNADDVTLSNFTIHNPHGNFAVFIEHKNNVRVEGLSISDVGTGMASGNSYGIYFQDSDAVNNSNVTISGNTISTVGSTTNGSNGGIGIGDSTGTGNLTNFTISDNTISNITANTTAVSPGKGAYGIIVNHASGASGNTGTASVQIHNNSISGLNGRWAHGIGMEGQTPNSNIEENTMNTFTATSASNDAVGIMFESNSSTSSVFVKNNFINTQSIAYGVVNVTSGFARVEYNDWNSTNPTTKMAGSVTFTPWWKPGSEMTIKQFPSTSTPTQTTATITSTYCSDDFNNMRIRSSSSMCITIPSETQITVTGPASWDGSIEGPISEIVNNPSIQGFTTTGFVSVSFGSSTGTLQFSQPIKITIYGEGGREVGWSQSSGSFTPITNVCTSNSAAGLGSNQDCKFNNEGDLVIWTRHLTTFTTFTSVVAPVSGGNGPIVQTGFGPSTSGIASGGSTSNPTQTFDSTHVATQEQSGVTGATNENQGTVAGATKFKFSNNMSYGSRLDPDVTELHKFLIAKGFLMIKSPTGWFGPLTRAAVKKYQKSKQIPETGVVGEMTRNALNQEI